MNRYFIHGLECTAHIGQNNWQKSVSQKIIVDIEWWPETQQNTASLLNNSSVDFEIIINSITELTSSKHWQSIDELTDQIKLLIPLRSGPFRITLSIPNAYAQTKSIGLTIESP